MPRALYVVVNLPPEPVRKRRVSVPMRSGPIINKPQQAWKRVPPVALAVRPYVEVTVRKVG